MGRSYVQSGRLAIASFVAPGPRRPGLAAAHGQACGSPRHAAVGVGGRADPRATIRRLAYWRKPGPDGRPVLTPEYSASRPIDYSFRDVIALRTCVRLRQEASLQKIRRALDALRIDLGLREHLSSYQLVTDGSTIYLADSEHAVDLVRQRGNLVIHQFVEVLQPFYVQGRQIPALLEPREHVQVDPGVRGGEPVISGTGFRMTRLPR